ncbi:MAG TPA: hypothetical protein DCY13_10265 [Verrucomicrobiales bacterium]|nr:hypothetical protein [Verrucomicrobiales bacterium]
MTRRTQLIAHWRDALAGAALCVVAGLALLWWGHGLVYLSYDFSFLIREPKRPDGILIIHLDDQSFSKLKQDNTAAWDRNLHALLLDRLTEADARLVVLDIVLDLPGEPAANTNLARAIRENGRVVLAADLDTRDRQQAHVKTTILPRREFVATAAGWGIATLSTAEKSVVRHHDAGTSTQPALAWRAAELVDAPVTKRADAELPVFWLNYHGPARTLPHLSYHEALTESLETFRDKVVFIGARPTTLKPGDEADSFRTPFTWWTHQHMPGVEIHATAYLNLLHGNMLDFWSWPRQVTLVALAGLLLGVIGVMRPAKALAGAVVVSVLTIMIAVQALKGHQWIPWTVVLLVQIPTALGWSLRCQFHRLRFEKEVLERTAATATLVPTVINTDQPDRQVPDHDLLRCVGRGAYGEVWLARNAIGGFHAVKLVRRSAFLNDEPYEREFKGIQRFMPISRSHPGFVHVLHAGRNDEAGFFYYVMEPADDRTNGAKCDPDRYAPKSLATELQARGQLAPSECLELGLALSGALAHLHGHGLIHRDLKPGNIIYVGGAAKLADIGLVTEQRTDARDVSLVGTEGYIPPEGPGTPSADVYALGKVLYEACMGRDRMLFPEVPTSLWEEDQDSLLRRLNDVLGRACASAVEDRFATAAELHAALLELGGK